jgi:hypothetical protein
MATNKKCGFYLRMSTDNEEGWHMSLEIAHSDPDLLATEM